MADSLGIFVGVPRYAGELEVNPLLKQLSQLQRRCIHGCIVALDECCQFMSMTGHQISKVGSCDSVR